MTVSSLEPPPELATAWAGRGYYGTVSHNTKAVYNRDLGYFDGNPANLDPFPPVPSAKKHAEFMGGADAVLKNARAAYDKGEYRWVAQVVHYAVFAEPGNLAAREPQADALEQLVYQAESGPWRNFYLSGARELRNADARFTMSRADFDDITLQTATLESKIKAGAVKVDGDPKKFGERVALLDSFDVWFNIVTP